MSVGERYRRVLRFEKVDRVPNMEQGPMGPRVEQDWKKQGMPADQSIEQFFGLESPVDWSGWPGDGTFDPIPGVKDQGLIEETDEARVFRDCWGKQTERRSHLVGIASSRTPRNDSV